MRPLRWILLGGAAAIALSAGALLYYLSRPLPLPEPVECWVAPGSSISQAVRTTAHCCRADAPELLVLLARVYATLSGAQLYAGPYRFGPEHRHWQLLYALFSGKQVARVWVTIPEGLTLWQIASLLAQRAGVDSAEFVRWAHTPALLQEFGISAASAEGYLFPSTYELFWRHRAEDVVRRLLRAQQRLWAARFDSLARQRGLSRHEVLTLASIIEAETPHPDERRRVSGVFYNRLRRGLPLQADPTVAYALGKSGTLLSRQDLRVEHPYNTYRVRGLPPGPINNPGADAISAALEPEEHDYLYFVLRRDGSRRHIFSRSYKEHLQAIASQQRTYPATP